MDRPHKAAIRLMGEIENLLSQCIGNCAEASVKLPAHVADFGGIATSLTSVKSTVQALVVTLQSE